MLFLGKYLCMISVGKSPVSNSAPLQQATSGKFSSLLLCASKNSLKLCVGIANKTTSQSAKASKSDVGINSFGNFIFGKNLEFSFKYFISFIWA